MMATLRELQARIEWVAAALVTASVLLLASGCVASSVTTTPPTSETASTVAASAPRVYFADVADGASVASPLVLAMASDNFAVVPAGNPKTGEGHLHIMVDTPCVADGQPIPKDDAHLHYGQGQLEAELTLAPGEHTLCLQAADGTHMALAGEGMRQQIRVTVEESEE